MDHDGREKTALIPAPVKSAASRTWHLWVLAAVGVISIGPAIWQAGLQYGPHIEGPGLSEFRLASPICRGGDLETMVETRAGDGLWASLKVRKVFPDDAIDSVEVRWQLERISGGTDADGIRRSGPYLIEFGCGAALEFIVGFRSSMDLGWWQWSETFGPFGPYGAGKEGVRAGSN